MSFLAYLTCRILLCACARGVKPDISLDTGPGFKNFGTGLESECEKVVPATSARDWVECFHTRGGQSHFFRLHSKIFETGSGPRNFWNLRIRLQFKLWLQSRHPKITMVLLQKWPRRLLPKLEGDTGSGPVSQIWLESGSERNGESCWTAGVDSGTPDPCPPQFHTRNCMQIQSSVFILNNFKLVITFKWENRPLPIFCFSACCRFSLCNSIRACLQRPAEVMANFLHDAWLEFGQSVYWKHGSSRVIALCLENVALLCSDPSAGFRGLGGTFLK